MSTNRQHWFTLTALAAVLAVAVTLLVPAFANPKAGAESPAEDYLSPELRARVERLKIEATEPSTDKKVLLDRLMTLWEWSNALSLTGAAIPFNYPLELMAAVHAMRGSKRGQGITPQQVSELIRRYGREFQVKDENPAAIGTVTISPPGPFRVGEHVTIEQTYTVGEMPMVPGGGIANVSRGQDLGSRAQNDDPTGDGYTTVRCSNPDSKFAKSEPWGSMLRAGRRAGLIYRLEGAPLTKGDTITITYGDTSGGSGGVKLQSHSNDKVEARLHLDLEGDGNFFTPDWSSFAVVGGGTAEFVNAVVRPSIVAPGQPFELAVRSEDSYKNPINGRAPAYRVLLGEQLIAEIPESDRAVTVLDNKLLRKPGVYRFVVRSSDGELACISNPLWVREDPAHGVFWGDTHGHTSMADGQTSADGYYRFGQDIARLDFLVLSEHDIWMDDSEWQLLKDTADRFLAPGEFTTFLGYEWTAQYIIGGHHNVYFRDTEGRMRVPLQRVLDLKELYQGLARENDPEDVLIIPHAHQAGDWRQNDASMERLAEIQSGHGTFEWFGAKYFENGYRLGFIGSSDNHSGHPGYSPSTNRQIGGLAAVLAPENTRDALFDAMRARATYATTGERILLDVDLNGVGMGQPVPATERRTVRCSVMGTAAIDSIELVKNGKLAFSQRYFEPLLEPSQWVQLTFASDTKVYTGHHNPRSSRSWRGSLEVHGARLEEVHKPWFYHPGTTRLDRETSNPNRLRFSLNTRGRGKALLLKLDGADETTRISVHVEPSREGRVKGVPERPQERLPAADVSFKLGALLDGPKTHKLKVVKHVDSIAAQLVSEGVPLDQEFSYTDLEKPKPGDFYYVRVRQVDGSMAWSSPWWIEAAAP
jgi:hypothetical protein